MNSGGGGFNRVKEGYKGVWVSLRTVEEVVSSVNEGMEGLDGNNKKGYGSSMWDFDSGPGATEGPVTPLAHNTGLPSTGKEGKTEVAEGERMFYTNTGNGIASVASSEREVGGREVVNEQRISGSKIGGKDAAASADDDNLIALLTDGAGVVNMGENNRTAKIVTSSVRKWSLQSNNINVGDVMEGKVHHLTPYGAFIDVGVEFNGLVHISQMSDKYVQNCSDVVGIGDTVMVRVIEVDPANKRLSLTLRSKRSGISPEFPDRVRLGVDAVEKYRCILRDSPDLMMKGKITQVKSYGAFIILEDGISGFVHYTHILEGDPNVKPSDVLKSGEKVSVRLREVDLSQKRINLSMLPLGCEPLLSPPQHIHHQNPIRMTVEEFSFLSNISASEWHLGVITSVADFGAFVHTDKFIGLIHLSRMPRQMKNSNSSPAIKHKYKVGDEVNVRVVGVNKERRRADLSATSPELDKATFLLELKNRSHDVWFEAVVNTIMPHYAFLTLESNIDGMLHLNEITGDRIRGTLTNVFNIGDSVKVRLLDVDVDQQRVKLTMKEPGYENQHFITSSQNVIKRQLNISYYEGLKPDQWIEGKVVSIQDYGAFISLDETTDGMVHISELVEEHVENVDDVLLVGQIVKARVIGTDRERKHVSLSLKSLNSMDNMRMRKRRKSKPWSEAELRHYANMDDSQYIQGKVINVVNFGAFVQLENGCDALLHVEDMKEYVGLSMYPHDVLEIGQEVTVSVKYVDFDKMTVNLSMGGFKTIEKEMSNEDLKTQAGNVQQQKTEETGKMDTGMYAIRPNRRKPRKKKQVKKESKNNNRVYKEDKINWAEALRSFYA